MAEAIEQQVCPKWIMESQEILGRCVPSITEAQFDEVSTSFPQDISWASLKKGVENLAKLLGLRDVGTKVFNDLKTQWWTILIGLVISCVVSFLWIVLMR